MSKHHKITSYVSYSLHINSFNHHKDFLRKGPHKVIQMNLAETLRMYKFPSQPNHSYATKLIRLLKLVKGLKRLSFDNFVLNNSGLNGKATISFIERVRRIQKLTLNDLWISLFGRFKTKLSPWMKHLRQIRAMTFKLEGSINNWNGQTSLLDAMRAFLKSLRCQNHMKSLTLKFSQLGTSISPIFLRCSQYPRSLENLRLLSKQKDLSRSDVKLPCFSLTRFKKLETFALKVTNDQAVVSDIMDTLPSLPHLKSLAVLLADSFVLPESFAGFHHCNLDAQVFHNLTHLSVRIPQEMTKTSLLDRLNLSNLQSLQLSLYLIYPHEYQRAASNLSKIKQLKFLNLSITYLNQLGDVLKVFFESIVEMELLTSFRIDLTSSHPLAYGEQIPSDILPILEKIFSKLAKIQDFSLECKKLIISDVFPRLIEIFTESASSFKKFKLDTLPFVLEDVGPLIRFVEGLENIRTLKLPCFEINSDRVLTRLSCALVQLKDVRSIHLGKIGGREKVDAQVYVESIERIIGKRGLCRFSSEPTENLKDLMKVLGSPISFGKITKKNPFLKFVSVNIFTFINMSG